jgi:proteasome assembly chaperone (PAC2) family protein
VRVKERLMETDIWIERLAETALKTPVAIVGSPGLRSIGKLVIDALIDATKAELAAELYSTHLPLIYQTRPSYAAHYSLPGVGGARVTQGQVDLPKVQFYTCSSPSMVLAKGYHANFAGQYDVAKKVVDFLSELRVTRIIVAAGYGSKTRKVCCAATNPELLQELKEKLSLEVDYVGPFYGFSGLVFGLAKLKGIDAVCLFAGTEPTPEDPEFPDPKSSHMILDVLNQMIGFRQ